MNGVLDSHSNSGCESGWTLYLDHSFLSPFPSNKVSEFVDDEKRMIKDDDEHEEEDLSMVSDASSGPPIFQDDDFYGNADHGCSYSASIDAKLKKESGEKRKKNKENRSRKVDQDQHLDDDTASSPVYNFNSNFRVTNNQASMENPLEYSEGCSATHIEGRSAFHEPFGFFQSPLSGNQLQQNQWLGGRYTGMR